MTNNQKEYGKLTAEQFKQLIQQLPELRKEVGSLEDVVKSASKERINELLEKDFYWAEVYELTFVEHLAFLMMALDKVEFLHEAKNAADPTQHFMDHFDIEGKFEHWNGGWNGVFKKSRFNRFGICISENNFKCHALPKNHANVGRRGQAGQ